MNTPFQTPFTNFTYHGWPATSGTIQQNANYRGSVPYVTGSHNVKAGYQGADMIAKTPTFVGQQISYRFSNGVPNQLTQRIGSALSSNRVVPDAVFVQDQWTRGRLTLQGGLRYEHVHSFFPKVKTATRRISSARASSFPGRKVFAVSTTSLREWVVPTTCLVTARLRSRSA